MPAPAVKKIKGKIVERKVADLTPHPDNAREHSDEQLGLIGRSIKEFGFTVPVLVDENGVILAGHGRVEAARKLGMDKVPTLDVAHLTDAQKKAFLVADNAIYERGGWNDEGLGKLILELSTSEIDLDVLGVKPDVIHGVLRDGRTDFLDAGNKEPRSRTRDSTKVSEFVQLNFTLPAEDRKFVMDVLKRQMQRRGLNTTGEVLVVLCRELDADGEGDGED